MKYYFFTDLYNNLIINLTSSNLNYNYNHGVFHRNKFYVYLNYLIYLRIFFFCIHVDVENNGKREIFESIHGGFFYIFFFYAHYRLGYFTVNFLNYAVNMVSCQYK